MKLDSDLQARGAELKQGNLWRILREVESPQGAEVEMGGRTLINFSSNDYLGLAFHPRLIHATREAVGIYGTGAGASRLISGNLKVHRRLEEELADFKETEAALAFSSGYATALGVIPSLVGKGDVVILDKLAHACLVDAARLSGATLRVFPHNDLDYLEALLKRYSGKGRILIGTESLFSMDGDRCPLQALVELKERHGAWLLVDEAHATGLFGIGGAGLVAEAGFAGRVEVQMGTLSKSLGAAGGYISGSRVLVEWLINRARSLVYSTAPAPAAAASAHAAVKLVRGPEGEELRAKLWRNAAEFQRGAGLTPNSPLSPIVPWIVGESAAALKAADTLRASGLWVPAIRFPTVARNKARLRITLTASHTPAHITTLSEALKTL